MYNITSTTLDYPQELMRVINELKPWIIGNPMIVLIDNMAQQFTITNDAYAWNQCSICVGCEEDALKERVSDLRMMLKSLLPGTGIAMVKVGSVTFLAE